MATVLPMAAVYSIERFGMTPAQFREQVLNERPPGLPTPDDLQINDPYLETLYQYAHASNRTYVLLGTLAIIHTYKDNQRAFDAFRDIVAHRPYDVEDSVNGEIAALHADGHKLRQPEQALVWAKRREILQRVADCMDDEELYEELRHADRCVQDRVRPLLEKAEDRSRDLDHARENGDWWGAARR